MQLPRYLSQLDVLRAVAILVVMVSHINGDVPSLHLGTVFHYGSTGVDLFFVLSGFLITGILLRTRNESGYFYNFYARRVLRIWPLYYLLLAVGFLLIPAVQPHLNPSIVDQCHPWQSYLFFLQNLLAFRSGTFGPLQITWSLCVEEQYYLIWPLIVFLLPPKHTAKFAIFAMFMSLSLRFASGHWLLLDTYHNTFCRLDGLAIGSLAAILLPKYEARTVRTVSICMAAVAMAGLAVVLSTSFAKSTFMTFVSLLFGALMCLSLTTPRFPAPRFMLHTGKISYGLYLVHVLAFDIVRLPQVRSLIAVGHNIVFNDIIAFVCSMALAFAFAQISWMVLESPALSLKRYFESPRVTAELRDNGVHRVVRQAV